LLPHDGLPFRHPLLLWLLRLRNAADLRIHRGRVEPPAAAVRIAWNHRPFPHPLLLWLLWLLRLLRLRNAADLRIHRGRVEPPAAAVRIAWNHRVPAPNAARLGSSALEAPPASPVSAVIPAVIGDVIAGRGRRRRRIIVAAEALRRARRRRSLRGLA
jgi:hypothetical protein